MTPLLPTRLGALQRQPAQSLLNDSLVTLLLPLLLPLLLAPMVSHAADATSYYSEAGSYATQRESDPPAYVKNIGQTLSNDLRWLEAGLEYRLRSEWRDDDLRRSDPSDFDRPFLQRLRAYVGVKEVLDPLRIAIELTDSRSNGSHYSADGRDENHAELIQGFAELYFPTAFSPDPRGNARSLQLRYGRQAFEALDRRLVARNEWRNTTNNFDGVRAQLGNDNNAWSLEAWQLHPVVRATNAVDEADHTQDFRAVILHWRPWSPTLTLEPHYWQLQQTAASNNGFRARNILAPGLRVYGHFANNAANFDVSVMQQRGSDNGQQVDAQAFTAELGYTVASHAYRPRFSMSYAYASGDKNPFDNKSNRFERFFGFARPLSADDYVSFENIRAPKLRVEFQPRTGWRVDAGLNWFKLASKTDRFNNLLAGSAANRDRSGASTSDLGTSWDIRLRFAPAKHLQATLGYSSFVMGGFVQARQRVATGVTTKDSDFFYAELVWRLFE